jgi:hypothetical protein
MEPLDQSLISTQYAIRVTSFPEQRQITVSSIRSSLMPIVVQSFTPDINPRVVEPIGTPIPAKVSTITVFAIGRGQVIAGIKIESVMLVQLRNIQEGVLAETWLGDIYEYGVGESGIQALEDLIVSLNEYLSVLTKNKDHLGDSAKKELDVLQRAIGVQKSTPGSP